MSEEEKTAMSAINKKLSVKGLKSRLSWLTISAAGKATVTEWGWRKIIPEEGAEPSIIVSEEIRQLFD